MRRTVGPPNSDWLSVMSPPTAGPATTRSGHSLPFRSDLPARGAGRPPGPEAAPGLDRDEGLLGAHLVQVEADLVAVERDRAVDIADGKDDDLEGPVHDVLPVNWGFGRPAWCLRSPPAGI